MQTSGVCLLHGCGVGDGSLAANAGAWVGLLCTRRGRRPCGRGARHYRANLLPAPPPRTEAARQGRDADTTRPLRGWHAPGIAAHPLAAQGRAKEGRCWSRLSSLTEEPRMAQGRPTALTIRLIPAQRRTLLAWQRATTLAAG